MTTADEFESLAMQLRDGQAAYILAAMNDLLTKASSSEIEALPAPEIADPYLANYVAAMVEQAAHRNGGGFPPRWTAAVKPLSKPVFATPWMSLRAHLLLESPIPFRRRNIFIDASIGDRV